MTFENTSGITPVLFAVLLKPDPMEEKTAGGIFKPDRLKDLEKWSQVKATIVACGDEAFGKPFGEQERKALVPGASVYFDKHVGVMMEGADGQEYRLCNDKEIGALVTDARALPSVMGRSRAGLDAG